MGQQPGLPRSDQVIPLTSVPMVQIGITDLTNTRAASAAGAGGDGAGFNTGLSVGAFLFNGSSWDRARNGSAAAIAAVTQQFAMITTRPGNWTVTNAPAANTQATASKAAGGAGVRHVCNAILATLVSTAAAAAQVTVVIRDGASGAGTILFQGDLAIVATADSSDKIVLSGLNIFGTANTAMTIEFTAAGGANTVEKVSMAGYSTI